jgi:hypothetical protein
MHDPIHSNLKFDSKIIDVNLLHGTHRICEEQQRRRPLRRKAFALGLMGLGLEREKFRIDRLRLDRSTLP